MTGHIPFPEPRPIPGSESDAPARLAELRPGEEAIILGIDGDGPIRERLLDLGLVPGTAIRMLRRAPLGDPVVYELRGYRLCLRRSEAVRIRLRPAPATLS